MEWHIITCEYPPQFGGVSDYTYQVARGLAEAGDSVHVWCPAVEGETPGSSGVSVHRDFGRFSPRDLWRVGASLNRVSRPRRLLVQWVPHGFGYRSMNVFFCIWLWWRSAFHGDRVALMVHEVFLGFAGSWKQRAAAFVHRIMTLILLRAPDQIFLSIPAWEKYLRPYALGRRVPYTWLPISSNVARSSDPAPASSARARYGLNGGMVIGHYGTFPKQINEVLLEAIPILLAGNSDLTVLLIGPGGDALRDRIRERLGDSAGRVQATGKLDLAQIPAHLSSCDVMLQPYPDGVSSRRTTMMAQLSLGLPVVTTVGNLTEMLWSDSGAVALAPVDDLNQLVAVTQRLLIDEAERTRLKQAAIRLYLERFDISHTIETLRAAISLPGTQTIER